MSSIQTGISVTTDAVTSPDFTFQWSAVLPGDLLTVTVNYGAGTALENSASASISKGSDSPQTLVAGSGNTNANVVVAGTVTANWGITDPSSYVVTFNGQMVEGGVM